MAQELRFRLNGTVYDGIANPEDFGITVAEEQTLGFRFVSYNNDLQLIGDAYAYLNGLIEDSCGCELVSVGVEFKCAGQWQKLCNGYIILAECITDMDRCKITTKLYDDTFSTKINNNKNIPFSLRAEVTKNLEPVTPPTMFFVDLFVPATGVYDTTNFVFGTRVEDALKHLVACMSDNLVDCVAPAFASGTYEWLMVMNGRQILAPQQRVDVQITFEQLFVALQRKLNISISTSLQGNGRPLLTIDYASVIDSQVEAASIINASGVKRKTDTARLYSRVGLGNDQVLEQWQCDGGEKACTFAQTPFLGFREESLGLIGNCNKDTELDLLVRDVIFDTNVIEDIFVWGSQSYELNPIIIQCEETVIPAILKASQYDPYNIGQTVYNGDFTNNEVVNNFAGAIPNPLSVNPPTYIQANTVFDYQADNTPELSYGIISGSYTSYVGIVGEFPVVGDAVVANSNYLLGRTFRIPYPGIYFFYSRFMLDAFTAFDSWTENYIQSILHYNSDEELINEYLGNVFTRTGAFNGGTGNFDFPIIQPDVNASFICNEGDLIRCNQNGNLVGLALKTVEIKNFINIAGTDRYSVFRGFGQNLYPEDIIPVDPCDFRGYLYDFEYPLTMADIQAIVQRPSAPVKFSRTGTINAGIEGTINQLNINSVIKQQGQFTIRSNEKL
jgi:hypothetical protein